ncbi:ATP-binding protein [Nocardioides sp.]|uniref:sensor histidine kinase n=1 Tax=Nocardioides sp. TaxID=35761 RepID=UPI0035614264
MSLRDRLIPIVAALAVLGAGVVVILMLNSASNDGIKALENAKLAQVRTTARSFNARVESSLGSFAGLGAQPWELTPDSAADRAILDTFALDPDARSGSFLLDANDTITTGVLLRDGAQGSVYDAPGWAEAKEVLAAQTVVVLPVTNDGFTTDLPSYAFAIAVLGEKPGTLRGAFIFEVALTEDSAFNQEIRALAVDEDSSAVWRFIDSNGFVVATSAASGLGEEAEDLQVSDIKDGLSQSGDRLIVKADVPIVGWRVVFTQERDEFTAPLAGPLRVAGLVLVLVMLGVGLVLVAILVRRLRQAREEERRLRELARSQEEFISVVSHELRTPVAGVLGFLQTTLDHWELMSEEERLTAVRRAFVNARRLQAMTRDVLDTESIESGQFGYTMTEVDLAAEVRTAAEGFLSGPDEQLRLDLPEGPVTMQGDPDRLQQVLANLLDNARKNAPPQTPIQVRLESSAGQARLVVEDQGGGIDADQVERIFEKFVRGRDGNVTGTGLGLYITRRIVEQHHGRLWAESTPGELTRFVVELPTVSGATPADTSADRPMAR